MERGDNRHRLFRVGEVATQTGISIRTLHHYDRIGLLRPTTSSEAGYRLYAVADLLRLQQILTLRYLGFSLKRIGELLARADFDLAAAMHAHRLVLRDRIGELERIDGALSELMRRRETSGDWDWEMLVAVAADVGRGLAQREDQLETYYTPEQMKRFEELGRQVPREEISAIESAWTVLMAEARAARAAGLDPASAEALALVERWDALTERTMRHYSPDLTSAVKENYERGAFEGHDRAPQSADFAWIAAVKSAHGMPGSNTLDHRSSLSDRAEADEA